MRVTANVTRFVTREHHDPYRPDPNLTGPTAYEWSPSIHPFSSVMAGSRIGWMAMKP